MVKSRHKVVSGRALSKVPDADSIRPGSQRRRSSAGAAGKTFADMHVARVQASSRLPRCCCFPISEAIKLAQHVGERSMKAAKTVVKPAEFRVWCEQCCIRIAPHEERTDRAGKAYHPRCYSRLFPARPVPKA